MNNVRLISLNPSVQFIRLLAIFSKGDPWVQEKCMFWVIIKSF